MEKGLVPHLGLYCQQQDPEEQAGDAQVGDKSHHVFPETITFMKQKRKGSLDALAKGS